jgi:hypothetical protein
MPVNEITCELKGGQILYEALGALPNRFAMNVIRPIVADHARRLAAVMASGASSDSGLLKKSLGMTPVKIYRKGTIAFAAAGPRRGFRRIVTMAKKPGGKVRIGNKKHSDFMTAIGAKNRSLGAAETWADPVHYAHLAEKGRKAIGTSKKKSLFSWRSGRFFGKHVAAAQGNPAAARAFQVSASMAPVMASEIDAGLTRELARLLPKVSK